MQRKLPLHIIKYYEALWCVADGRIILWKVADGIIHAQVKSSDSIKTYNVSYSQETNEIMSNDNSSYRKDELWYPSLALLLFLDRLDYQDRFGSMLSHIPWKKINTKNKNDRDLTQHEVDDSLRARGRDVSVLFHYCEELMTSVEEMHLWMLWNKQQPPSS